MKKRLPKNLSPGAKKAVLTGDPEARVGALVELSRHDDLESLCSWVEEAGGEVRSFSEGTGLLALEIPVASLVELARRSETAYVDAETRFQL